MSLRNFPDANTSITLDFLKGKKLDPRITFERASSATEIGEGTGAVNGQLFEFQENVPRLTDQGLLVEEARTNVELNSATLGDWTRNELTEATNNQVAPDGTTTSSTFTVTTTDAGHNLEMSWQNGGGSPPYPRPTYSVFVKPGTAKKIFIFDPNNARAAFDFTTSNPVVVHAHKLSNIDTAATCQSYGNGWYRISVSSSSSAWQSHNVYIGVYSTLPTGFGTDGVVIALSDFDYAGTGETVAFWGVQREQPRSSTPVPPTSYIPTSGTTATRAPDLCEITGDEFSSWYNQGEGTFVVSATPPNAPTFAPFFTVASSSNLSFQNIGIWRYQNTSVVAGKRIEVFNRGSSSITTIELSPENDGVPFKAAVGYGTNIAASYDGGTVSSDTLQAVSPDILCIGARGTYADLTYISRISYYPTRVSDDALEALTS